MASVARLRVELIRKHDDPDKNFRDLLKKYMNLLGKEGIVASYKANQVFESKSQERRRKKRATRSKHLHELIIKKTLIGEKINASPGLVNRVMTTYYRKEKEREMKEREKEGRGKY